MSTIVKKNFSFIYNSNFKNLKNFFLFNVFFIFLRWLNVYLALYRYLSMSKTMSLLNKNPHSCIDISSFLLFKSNKTIFLIVLMCIFICFPSYLYPMVKENKCSNSNNITQTLCYYSDQSQLNEMSHDLIFKLSFYFQALFVKIVPCILLVVFISLLVKIFFQLRKTKKENVKIKKITLKIYFIV